MLYPEYCWVDTAFGGPNKRNNLTDIRRLKVPQGVPDCYRTVYRYPDAMKEHFDRHKTVSGYNGPVYADWLPVDIDDKDLEAAHATARVALESLSVNFDVDPGHLWCFFSGSKGFHILIPAVLFGLKPGKELPDVFRRLAEWLFQGISLDMKIYDTVRLFRFTNTLNSKSGLYKIPLTAAEIMHEPTEKILELARSPRQLELISEKELDLNPVLNELYCKALAEVTSPAQKQSAPGPAQNRSGAKVKPCIARLLEGVGEGERNEAGLRIAVHYAKEGLAQDMVQAVLEAWNQRNIPPLPQRELAVLAKEALEKPYDFGCNDVFLKKYCGQPCPVRRTANGNNGTEERDEQPVVKTIEDAKAAYLEYVASLRQAKVTLGFGAVDNKMRGIAPGEVCQIIARSAVGKTTFLLNILKNASLGGVRPMIFFTMEMPLAQVFERMCQMAAGRKGAEVEQAAIRHVLGQADEFADIASQTVQVFRNVYFVENDGLTLEQIEQCCRAAEQHIGEKIRVVAIDYMGRMQGGYGTPYEVTSRIAKGLKYLAKKLNVAVISLHQTSREGGGEGTEPVTIQSARDSGAVEEAADFLIGLWRPKKKECVGLDKEPVAVALLKNRRGSEVWTEITFEKPTLRMYDDEGRYLTDDEVRQIWGDEA